MQEQKPNSEQKDETQLPSSPNNSNTDVVRSPNSVSTENDLKKTKDAQDVLEWYLDKIEEYEKQGWEKQTIDACKLNLVLYAIRTKRCSELVSSLKNLFE